MIEHSQYSIHSKKQRSSPLFLSKKEAALSSYGNYNNNVRQDVFKEEFVALQNLRKNIANKSDNGKSAVIIDKTDYLDKTENLLNDTYKFKKLI